MNVLLTPKLLEHLISKGYRYFLSSTSVTNNPNVLVTVTLIPVVEKPVLRLLPEYIDTYFEMEEEPRQMALGVDDTEFVVKLPRADAGNFEEQISQVV